MDTTIDKRLEWLIPFLLFLGTFLFLLLGVNPSFFLDDSPETITAAIMMGIPHPPGYPLHTLTAHFFTMMPLGHPGFRVNLFSAVLASLVSMVLYLYLSRGLEVSRRLSLLFALFWVVGAGNYPAALSAKTGIYHLTALFLVVILWALKAGRIQLAVFLWGLSLANHWMSMVVFAPGLLWAGWETHKDKEWGGRETVLALTGVVLGLSVYLYLPFRSIQMPLLNWGEPSNWTNFLFNFSRTQYQGSEISGSVLTWLKQFVLLLKAQFIEFSGLILLALWGFVKIARRKKGLALGMGAAWVSLLAALSVYLNLPKEQYYLIPQYALSANLFILIFAAWGLEWALAERSPEKRGTSEWWVIALLILGLLGMGSYRFLKDRQTTYTLDYDYVLNGYRSLPEKALYYCKGDSIIFPSWYFQWVEDKRLDVAVVGVDGLPMVWVRRVLAGLHPGLKVPFSKKAMGVESIPAMLAWMIQQNPDRELYFSYNKITDNSLPAGTQLVPYGIAHKGFMPNQVPVIDDARAEYCWWLMRLRHLKDPGIALDERSLDFIYKDYGVNRNSLGVFYEDRGDEIRAKLTPKSGVQALLKEEDEYQKSYRQYLWAQEWDNIDAMYPYNVGNALYHLGRKYEATQWYERATAMNPQYAEAFFNWAITDMEIGQYQKSGELFQKVIDLKPDYPDAKRGLDYLKTQGVFHPAS